VAGWSAYPLFHRKRTGIFVMQKPVTVAPGATVRLLLGQYKQSSGHTAQAIRRVRFAVSSDSAWTDLLAAQSQRLAEVNSLQKRIDEIPAVSVPVMAQQPASQLRETRVFHRGNWLDKGALVT